MNEYKEEKVIEKEKSQSSIICTDLSLALKIVVKTLSKGVSSKQLTHSGGR